MHFSMKSVVLVVSSAIYIFLCILIIKQYKESREISSFPNKFLSAQLATYCRLGNHIFELVSVLGIAEKLQRTPVFWIENKSYEVMLDRVRNILPGLVKKFNVRNRTMPSTVRTVTFNKEARIYEDPSFLTYIPDDYLHISGNFYQSWKYFPDYRTEIRSYLKHFQEFSGLPKANNENFVLCAHSRRGDFTPSGFYPTDADFLKKAVKFIKNRYETRKAQIKTVVFGDDLKFMKSLFDESIPQKNSTDGIHFKSSHFISTNSPADDLLYAAQHCDTVLITAPDSTFAWWMAYLSKGNDAFYLDIRTVKDKLYESGGMRMEDYYLPHWTMLKSHNGTVIESQ